MLTATRHTPAALRPRPLSAWAVLLLGAGPVMGAHPEASVVALPDTPGASLAVEWTGRIPAAAETTDHCITAGRYDAHAVMPRHATSPDRDLVMRVTAAARATGPSAPGTDLMVTILRPDGRTQTADAGFAGVAEEATLFNPAQGPLEVRVCAVGGVTPQHYQASLSFVAAERGHAKAFFQPAGASACEQPPTSQKFVMEYVDQGRAGGEPFIVRHPDGQLLWGSHAGTTHFYSPSAPSPASGAFVENYEGQTYYYVAEAKDNYESWHFVPRLGPSIDVVAAVEGVPASGFSDPEFAIDQAGNVYVSEINLANIAVSKSTDGGRSYVLQNVIAFSMSDRQWMAADRENELYMAASGFGGGPFPSLEQGNLSHFIAKSKDGGVTFGDPFVIDPIVGDIQVDKARGILYSLYATGGALSIARFPNIRQEDTDFTVEILPIADPAAIPSGDRTISPTFDLDSAGNLYVTWPERGAGPRPAGIYYAYSTDQGETWSQPLRVDTTPEDDLWPWIAAGDPGQVVITWLQTNVETDAALPGEAGAGSVLDRVQASPDKPWHVMVAHSSTALGCTEDVDATGADLAAFTVTRASSEPPHTGTICQGGTLCQAEVVDRRLGDYFSIEVAGDGSVHAAVSDTRQGGAVALPLHLRQVGGPRLMQAATRETPGPTSPPVPERGSTPADRGGSAAPLWLILLAGFALRRRSVVG